MIHFPSVLYLDFSPLLFTFSDNMIKHIRAQPASPTLPMPSCARGGEGSNDEEVVEDLLLGVGGVGTVSWWKRLRKWRLLVLLWVLAYNGSVAVTETGGGGGGGRGDRGIGGEGDGR